MLTRRTFLASVSAATIAARWSPAVAQPLTSLRAAPADIRIEGLPVTGVTDALLWNGAMPGPILRTKGGQDLAFDMANDLAAPLSLHWLGWRGPNALDGVAGLTGPALPARQKTRLMLPVREPGFLLYRPMVPGQTAELTDRGLAGALVVEDAAPELQPKDEIIALIDDVLLEETGRHVPFGEEAARFGPGRLGNHLLVNGRAVPLEQAVMPGARVRLRIGNISNARILRLRIEGARATVIAVDSQPCDAFEPSRGSLPFLPGTRYELLLDMPPEPGVTARLIADLGQPLPLVVLTATLPDRAEAARQAPSSLPRNASLPVEIRLQDALRTDLVLTGGALRNADGSMTMPPADARNWRINGKTGDVAGDPHFRAGIGKPVVLALINRTQWFQALHLHGHCVRRLHALDDGWEPYWLDTIGIAPGQTVRIAFIADNPGKWLIGSSVLERLDAGLFTWFEVA